MINRLIRKGMILAGVLTGKHSFTGPDCVLISITDRCNFHCLNCRFHSTHTRSDSRYRPLVRQIPMDLIDKITPELRAAKVGIIVVSGSGEPLLHPQFTEIITRLKATNARIKLLSNGSLLTPSKAAFLVDQGLDELRISLWAKDKEEFAANYPGTPIRFFDRVIENIKQVAALKKQSGKAHPVVSIHHPINRNNFKQLDRLPQLAREWGIDEISFSALIPYPEVDQKSLLTPGDMPRLTMEMEGLKAALDRRGIRHNIQQTLFQQEFGEKMTENIQCYNGWFQMRIQEDGQVSPCNTCNIFVGNAHTSSISELWHGEKMKGFREKACTAKGLQEIAKDGFCSYCSSHQVNRNIHGVVSRIPFIRAGK